jgi:hypothetical protein
VLTVLNKLDKEYGEEDGTFLSILRHLIAKKEITVNMLGNMDFSEIRTEEIGIKNQKNIKEELV